MRPGLLLAALLCYVTPRLVTSESYPDYDYEETEEEGQTGLEWKQREGTKLEYHFHDNKKNFDKASSFCQAEDADLTAVEDQAENDWVHTHRHQSDSQWIGLRKHSTLEWIWVDWITVFHYKNFANNEPKTKGNLCAGFTDRPGESRWYTYDCDIPREFICKREKSPCVPSPCHEDEECRVDGDDYECICHHCESDLKLTFAKWTSNTFLLVIGIFIVVVVVIILLVILGTCLRGCLESRRSPVLPVKYTKEESPGNDHNSSNSNLYNTTPKQKPPVPPNKPKWKPNQSETSPSLSDSARGRSPGSTDNEDDVNETTKINIELHREKSVDPPDS